MQRFSATNAGGGVGNAIGGVSARDSARADSSFASSNFTLNSRRQVQITPYKLKCDRESLSARLGPPDFYPQASNCPEETLTNDYANHGYREIAEGIEESREILLTQHGIIDETCILKCKEAIRKCLRAINESRAHKRKAGQVYEVPLSGQLLLKPGIFPEQKPCTDDFKKKWIEGLSQQHKRLRSLADHVPHGYRRRALFEVLIKHNVPLLRATWFIKITYLNQVRPVLTSVSSGSPDKTLVTRTELWTKDVIDYLQLLLDEFSSKDNYFSNQHGRDLSSQMSFSNALQFKDDTQAILVDCEEPALQFKWWYMVRLLLWLLAEGLVLSSHVIEWVLKQLQEKESIEVLQLLLPIIFYVVESIMICQTHVRSLVDLAVRNINYLSSSDSHVPDDFNKSYFTSALVELVRFLLVSVPDTFVALDCFPLPLSVVPDGANHTKMSRTDFERIHYVPDEIMNNRWISFGYIASSVRKRASSLATAVNPGFEGCNVARVVQSLDRSLIEGDIRAAYSCLFENPYHGRVDEGWIAEVSPYLRSSLKWIGTVSFSVLHSVFLLCEWAACDYRDSRTKSSLCPNFSGRKDFSQVYVAVQLLNLWVESTKSLNNNKNISMMGSGSVINGFTSCDGVSGGSSLENVSSGSKTNLKSSARVVDSDILQSPGPMHDIIVCWLDLHEPSKSEGFKRLYMLVLELIRVGIFYPQAYVRQLIVSGIMDYGETFHEMSKKRRHNRILKQLPGPLFLEAFEEAKIADVDLLSTVVNIYSNERRLLLQKRLVGKHIYRTNGDSVNGYTGNVDNASKKHAKLKTDVAEVRTAISNFLNLSSSTLISTDSQIDMAQSYTLKRSISSTGIAEGTAGCEECLRSKKQKVSEDKSSHLQVLSPNPSDDEDIWWVRKGTLKSLDSSFKIDPPKLAKHAPRGRQKNVRKTHSLAQLAAARMEGSQGASTSHVCDNKVSCPHHRPVVDGEGSKFMDGLRTGHDLVALGKTLKQLRLLEKRSATLWLISTVKHLLDGAERASAKVGHFGGPYSAVDERSSIRWKLSEDELSIILYLLDISCDFQSAVKFLLWLLPKTSVGSFSSIQSGGSHSMLPKNAETRVLDVGEPFVLSAIRRYENILIAADLLPEYLTVAMNRSVFVMASSGRASSSAAFIYARNVLKRFGCIASVVKWEKTFKATCDQRLLAELETGRALDSELGFSPVGFPAGVEDVDDYFRQKITSKLSRAGPTMKEIVQRHIEEVLHYYLGKERKAFSAVNATTKPTSAEKLDDGFQIAQQITFGLLGCIRQNAGGAQDVDPSLVAAAVSAIIGNVGSTIAKMPDFSTNSTYTANFSSNITASSCARRILSIHISCLSLLKDALGDRQSRVFEIAIATEAFSIVAAALASGKSQARNQYQLSPENHDSNTNISNEILSNSTKAYLGRAVKAAAAVSALVIGAVVCGVTNLERMVSCFKLKEGLDVLQFIRGMRSSSNGVSRSAGAYKVDSGIEAYVHWFRVLIGNCRTVFDGLLIELLGDHYVMALSRMQRVLPINLVFPPAYSTFGMAIWRTYIFNSNISMREDNQLYHSIILAITEAVKHQPFRDVCLRDSHAFYEHLTTDVSDAEFAAMLENHSSEQHLKMMAFVPLRARLFLNAVLDSKMPKSVIGQDDGARIPGHSETKSYAENETKLLDQLVHVLDTLQPAKFHWQWIELRLLLNEQVLMEKIETHSMSLVEAIRSLSPNSDNFALSDNENNFMEIVLTRLLVRPDAASLYSEVVHLLGRSLEESLLKHAKWLLAGHDVLLGRKTIRQRLVNVAQQRGLSTKAKFWKLWGWSNSVEGRGDKRKVEVSAIEEGEVVEDGVDFKRSGKPGLQVHDSEGHPRQQYVTEKALTELVLPCIDRSSSDSRNTFASDLIKQLNTIEQHISGFTRGTNKQAGVGSSGFEVVSNKSGVRSKSMRGGSPGMGRRAQVVADLPPSSAAALRASMWLRLQFLLRLLPVIYVDRESSARNMRHMLASVLLRLLGNRVVYEDSDLSVYSNLTRKGEADSDFSLSPSPSGDSQFDRFLCVLHGLLSRHKPVWMKFPKSHMKSTDKFPREFPILDREVAESLQAELDRMQLPTAIRRRIQAVMPVLPLSLSLSISCKAPTVTLSAVSMMQPCTSVTGSQHNSSQAPRSPPVSSSRHPIANASSKGKSIPQLEVDLEMDPWLLLEDGTGCGPTLGTGGASVGGDNVNLKASNWLKGAVRVRRTDLTYIGPVDDDT